MRDSNLTEVLGLVTTTTRRSAQVLNTSSSYATNNQKFEILNCSLSNQVKSVCAGDRVAVQVSLANTKPTIVSLLERKNCLSRSYGNKTKIICANLDHLFVISASGSLENTVLIDRVLVAAKSENITTTVVINKSDLGDGERLSNIYKEIGYRSFTCSAKTGENLEHLKELIYQSQNKIVALCGISGVGKSSIVNSLIPGANRKVNQTSRKTGQGQQTTSQALGTLIERNLQNEEPLLLIDTPGIQNFGVSFIKLTELRLFFPEFLPASKECEYRDCQHLEESNCGVINNVNSGVIEISRYKSYLNIYQELQIFEENRY